MSEEDEKWVEGEARRLALAEEEVPLIAGPLRQMRRAANNMAERVEATRKRVRERGYSPAWAFIHEESMSNVMAAAEELKRRFTREFEAVLWGESDAFRPEGYLALTRMARSLAGRLQAELDGEPDDPMDWAPYKHRMLQRVIEKLTGQGWGPITWEYDTQEGPEPNVEAVERQVARYNEADLPYLYARWREAAKEYQSRWVRFDVVRHVLSRFENEGARPSPYFRGMERSEPDPPAISQRGLDYLAAVLKIKEEGVEPHNPSAYFKEVADRSPTTSGTVVSATAPWVWFRDNGYINAGHSLAEIRQRLEDTAERVIGPRQA